MLISTFFFSTMLLSTGGTIAFAKSPDKAIEPQHFFTSYENEAPKQALQESEYDTFVDLEGNKTQVPSVKFKKIKKEELSEGAQALAAGTSEPLYVTSDGYLYSYDSWTQSSATKYLTTFRVLDVSIDNRTSSIIKLKYTQESSVTKAWSVDAEISGSSSFTAAFLGKVEASLSIGASKSKTAYQSTTVEIDMDVHPGKRGSITKYFPGGYATGTSSWRKYTSTGTYVGMMYKANDGYSVATNHDHFDVREITL